MELLKQQEATVFYLLIMVCTRILDWFVVAISHTFSTNIFRYPTASIGLIASLSIAINSLTGPAMLNLPATFQRSGLIPTTLCLVFVGVLSALCSLHMADIVSKVPNNSKFKLDVGFSGAFETFWGKQWFYVTHIIYFCCVACLNISSIVDTSQVVDTFLGHWTPSGSRAFQFNDTGVHWIRWDPEHCTEEDVLDGTCLAFAGSDGILLTVGYMLTTLVLLPMALMDLKENATWQISGTIVLLVISIQFAVEFIMKGINIDNLSLWGDSWDTLFGVVLFNFALVIAIPAWLFERHPSVDVPTVIHNSSGMAILLYILVGALGALSIPNVSENMLESMMSGAFGTSMQLGSSLFALMIIGLGIPLFSVLMRMNLTGSNICNEATGNLLAVYFPFSISWLLYQGEAVTQLLSWGGVLFTSIVAFILPLLLALHTVLEFDVKGSIQVYFGYFSSKRSQIIALVVLLGLSVISVMVALLGNLLIGDTTS